MTSRIRAAVLFLLLPIESAAHEVEWTDTKLADAPSHLENKTLPKSKLAGVTLQSMLAPLAATPALSSQRAQQTGHYLAEIAPGRTLAGMASSLHPQEDFPASHLAVQDKGQGQLGDFGLASVARLDEVDSTLRDRTAALLRRFGARQVDGRIIVNLPGDVLFDFDKSDIRADAAPVLEQMAEILRAFGDAPVIIAGHTDAKGSDGYNLALSDRRSASVRDWLATRGILPARIETEGFGESRPVAPNTLPDGADSPEGRQLNRRVEFIILHPED